MLNTRNVVAAAVLITLISLVGACLALFERPGGGGLGTDSYGTRGHGYLALYEMLAALDVPVERADLPPDRLLARETTLAFLEPSPEIVSTEPAYLHAVSKWVQAGGTVVVSPSPRQRLPFLRGEVNRNVLTELGLDGLRVELVRPRGKRGSGGGSYRSRRSLRADTKRAAENFTRLFGRQAALPTSTVHATAEGSLATLFPHGLDLVLFDEGRCVIDSDWESPDEPAETKTMKPAAPSRSSPGRAVPALIRKPVAPAEIGGPVIQGRIRAVLEPGGQPETLAALYTLGKGTIAVLADAQLAQNRLVGQKDNPVLVGHLLADFQKPVVFDEFYHGLTMRANPLWLLSRFPYDILAASVLAATVLAGWHAARFLGPPLAPRPASRRTLSEYIEAMARLLNRSRRPVPFLLTELRQGLVWRLRHDLGLPPGPDDASKIVWILERRDPELAEKAREAIRAIDDSLAHPQQPAQELSKTLAKVSVCVPRHVV